MHVTTKELLIGGALIGGAVLLLYGNKLSNLRNLNPISTIPTPTYAGANNVMRVPVTQIQPTVVPSSQLPIIGSMGTVDASPNTTTHGMVKFLHE